jgi:hypothetical protein
MNFQRFNKSILLFGNPTFAQAPGTFQCFTDMPSVYTKLPEKEEGDAIGSPGHGSGGSGQHSAAGSAGEDGEDD